MTITVAALLALGGGNGAKAQTAIPTIMAEAWPTPVHGYAHFRIRMANWGTEVHGGALTIRYTMTCVLDMPDMESCPAGLPRTGETTIPCASSESGSILHAMGSENGGTQITLEITQVRFDKWEDDMINNINARYGAGACETGTYSPILQTTGTRWIASVPGP